MEKELINAGTTREAKELVRREFSSLADWQLAILHALFCQRQVLIMLLKTPRAGLASAQLKQLEQTTNSTECVFMALVGVTNHCIPQSCLSRAQSQHLFELTRIPSEVFF